MVLGAEIHHERRPRQAGVQGDRSRNVQCLASLGKGTGLYCVSSYRIETVFTSLMPSNYRITSPASTDYNCIAWAAGTDERWWWPDNQYTAYWPDGVPREETIAAFIQAYSLAGYISCDTCAYESGFEKIVIYTDERGKPTHAARQTPTGRWTSKLGNWEDIEHDRPDNLVGRHYGRVTVIMKRPNLMTPPRTLNLKT